MASMYRFVYILVAFFVFLPALAAARGYFASSSIREAQLRASRSYLETAGKVVQSEVRDRNARYERLYVRYEFEVDGKKVSSDNYAYTHDMRAFLSTDQALAKYPVGATVAVFYDPLNPQESVLNNAPPNMSAFYANAVFALFSAVVGTCLILSNEFRAKLKASVSAMMNGETTGRGNV